MKKFITIGIVILLFFTNSVTGQKITFDIDTLSLKDNIIKKDSFVYLITPRETQKQEYPSPFASKTKRFGLSLNFDVQVFPLDEWVAYRETVKKQTADSENPTIKQLLDQRTRFLEDIDRRIIELKEANTKIKKDKTTLIIPTNGIR